MSNSSGAIAQTLMIQRAAGSSGVVLQAAGREEYYAVASQFRDFNLYQTWDFAAEAAAAIGGRIDALVVRRGGQAIGTAILRTKTLPLVGWGVAYALYGPLWQRDGARIEDLACVLAAIRDAYGCRRGLSVRLRPKIYREHSEAAEAEIAFLDLGFRRIAADRPAQTLLVDLRPPPEEIRSRLQRRWRNYLGRAERGGLELSTDQSEASFTAFQPLYDELKRSKGFEGIDEGELYRVHVRLPETLKMHVTLCRRNGRLIAGQVASHLGDTCTGIIGASNAEGRECYATNLVWWERFNRAKADGRAWYDLGGIDLDANRGVAETKSRLGGTPATLLGEYRYEPSAARAWLLGRAEALYRRRRGSPQPAHTFGRAPHAVDPAAPSRAPGEKE